MIQEITFAPFEPAHIEAAHGLSQAVSWPHRQADWAMVLGLSRGVVALEGRTLIGTALVTPFGSDYSAANMIIVKASHQGRGLGRKLMTAILPNAGTCRLVATNEGLPLYRKLGFVETGQICLYQGPVTHVPQSGANTRHATAEDVPAIVALENRDAGGDRSALVRWLFEHGQIFVIADETRQVIGYCALRDFGRGQAIGPVVAPDRHAAGDLITAAAAGLERSFLRIDTHADAGLHDTVKALGLSHVGGGTAMQRGTDDPPTPRFAVFNQALG